jgi:hypothetical protein
VYLHSLHNTGSISDTYTLTWSSSQGWASVSAASDGIGISVPGTATLVADQTLVLTVTVNVPSGEAVRGLIDTTIITATSVSPTLSRRVTDMTLVPRARVFLPMVLQN